MRFLITSALPYINGVKHLGNLVGSMLPADVYARFLRREGADVLFVCGTDEHGTPAELAALDAGLDVATYCRIQHERQAEIYRRFGLSFDHFGRTSSPSNHELTQHFYRRLYANDFISERETSQIYSLDDARFLPDRYVIGICPRCKYPGARGDQCENCTSVLEPTELVEPRSAISGSARLEVRKSKHLFLSLSKLSDEVRAWVNAHPDWPALTKSIALKWLNEGLQDRGITRDLSWGVPVPRDGFEEKVFYVWFDAPIGYIAASVEWAQQQPADRDWKTWWFGAEEVRHVQFMAKDNLPFHTVMFPAMLLGTREPWKMADYIKGFHWLTYYGGKFSTSEGRGVFSDKALEILPPDYWRYALLAMVPESSDSAFTWELLQAKINSDLADNLGNFVNRTLKFAATQFGEFIPEGGRQGERERKLQSECARSVDLIATHLRKVEFRKAVDTLRGLWSVGNLYIYEQAPWKLIKQDREAAAQVTRMCINLLGLYAVVSEPFIPFTSATLFDALGMSQMERDRTFKAALDLNALEPGRPFTIPAVLFRKIESVEVTELREKFGT